MFVQGHAELPEPGAVAVGVGRVVVAVVLSAGPAAGVEEHDPQAMSGRGVAAASPAGPAPMTATSYVVSPAAALPGATPRPAGTASPGPASAMQARTERWPSTLTRQS